MIGWNITYAYNCFRKYIALYSSGQALFQTVYFLLITRIYINSFTICKVAHERRLPTTKAMDRSKRMILWLLVFIITVNILLNASVIILNSKGRSGYVSDFRFVNYWFTATV